ncbi:MAG: DUF1080 domain-containing protein [Acidobacteria bacterium]|nr:DUF1080 domain-containing protein [Acidobacteriota bacterium]
MPRHLSRLGVSTLVLSAALALPGTLTAQSGAPGPWKQLFNGKDLTNFTIPAGRGRAGAPPPAADAPPGWHVVDGVIIGGEAKPGERAGALTTVEKYSDFELEFDFVLGEVAGKCSEELGPKEENLSDPGCVGNSGVSYRSGYQMNIGRREGGEYIGLVIHRVDPKAIRGNILWLSHGDKAFPNLRKRQDWNTLRIAVKGDHHQAWLNGTKIVDVTDKSTLESEADWRVAQPITFQMPYTPGVTAKFRNIRVRTL